MGRVIRFAADGHIFKARIAKMCFEIMPRGVDSGLSQSSLHPLRARKAERRTRKCKLLVCVSWPTHIQCMEILSVDDVS